MITYNYCGKEQKVYFDKLENGLEVYTIPNKNKKNYLINIVVNYGSLIESFIPFNSEEYFDIPLGTAHYLEHKLFDMENGDFLKYFNEKNIYSNAGTNYFYTEYFIEGDRNIKKYFNALLDMFFTPYFTDSSIDKERGIISEEIKMYTDDALYPLLLTTKRSLFKYAFTEDIAGTCESIKKINKDVLDKVYDTFYNPNNVCIIASGNVSRNKILDIINNNESLNKRKSHKKIVYKTIEEDKYVVKEYAKINGNVISPKIAYFFKIDLNDYKFIDKKLIGYYIRFYLSIIFGDASIFYANVIKNNLANDVGTTVFDYQNISAFGFIAESDYADLLKEEIDKELNNKNIKEEDFEREKKKWLTSLIRSIDYPNSIVNNILYSKVTYGKYIDEMELINLLNYQDFLKFINKLDLNNKSFNIMLPNEE